jgi:hypothetical protein
MIDEPAYRSALRSIGVSEMMLDTTDDQYRALGRFHYQFTRVITCAYLSIASAGTKWWPNRRVERVKNALLTKTAGRSMPMWFDLCREAYNHDEAEAQVLAWFEGQFVDYNRVRNMLSHGLASLGYGSPDSTNINPRYGKIEINGRYVGDDRLATVESMDLLSDDLWYYRRRLSEYTIIFQPDTPEWPRQGIVKSNLEFRNGRVERVQPLTPRQDLLTGG